MIPRAAIILCVCFLGCRSERAAGSAHRASRTDSAGERPSAAAPADTGDRSPKRDGSAASAVAVIRDYYAAIDARDYRRAYAAWERDGAASGRSFEAFRAGFDRTATVAVEVGTPSRIEGAAGSRYIEIPVRITARTTGGEIQHFRGTYTLRRAVVTGASPEQRTWHIYSAHIAALK